MDDLFQNFYLAATLLLMLLITFSLSPSHLSFCILKKQYLAQSRCSGMDMVCREAKV